MLPGRFEPVPESVSQSVYDCTVCVGADVKLYTSNNKHAKFAFREQEFELRNVYANFRDLAQRLSPK